MQGLMAGCGIASLSFLDVLQMILHQAPIYCSWEPSRLEIPFEESLALVTSTLIEALPKDAQGRTTLIFT
jgi:hypothetical protein